MMTDPAPPPSRTRTARLLAPILVALAVGLMATPARGQETSALDRISALDIHRFRLGRMTVLYSASDLRVEEDTLRASARRTTALLANAGDYFAEALGGEFTFGVALLSPRDWVRASEGGLPVPWSSRSDRLVVLPVRPDLTLMAQSGPDPARPARITDIITLHQLGHVVAGAYLYPSGFSDDTPPLRWFEELLASWFGEMYMRARKPELAAFAEKLANDVVARTTPRFTSLDQLDEYYDAYLTSPQGANTLGWYQNAFNLRAAELFDDMGPDFIRRLKAELPWARFENWTTDELLAELEDISPGFIAWADEMAERTRKAYR